MSTKQNPGQFDCYAAAASDEEMFILLARDPMAGALVRLWADARELLGEDPAKVREARECADRLDQGAVARHKKPAGDWRVLAGYVHAGHSNLALLVSGVTPPDLLT